MQFSAWNVQNGDICRDHGNHTLKYFMPDQNCEMELAEEDLADATCAQQYTKEKENVKEEEAALETGGTEDENYYGWVASGCRRRATKDYENYNWEHQTEEQDTNHLPHHRDHITTTATSGGILNRPTWKQKQPPAITLHHHTWTLDQLPAVEQRLLTPKEKCQQHNQKPAGMKDVSVQEVRGVSGSQSAARQKMPTRKWWTLLLAHLLIMSHHPQPNGSSPQYLRTTLGQALTAGMNQQEILEAAAKANSQSKSGGKGGGKQGAKRRATEGGHKDDQHEMLRSLTRSYLYFKADAMPILDSSVVVVLFRKATLAKKFAESAAKWHSHEPAAVERGQKRQPHPWGPKKVFMLTQLWKEMSDKTAQMPEENDGNNAKSQCLEATKRLSGLTPAELDGNFASFRSTFKTPMAGRTWKWNLTLASVAGMECRTALAVLLGHFKDKDEELIVAQRRSQQPEEEKALWSFANKKD